MKSLWTRLTAITDVVESDSMFTDGLALWVNGKEIAHLHHDHLEVRLTRSVIRARPDLTEPPFVSRRTPSSDWVIIELEATESQDLALAAVSAAAYAHSPPPGTTPAPPPTGADLERRRRFH